VPTVILRSWGVEHWEFNGGIYEVVSFYSVADDARTYELTGPGASATVPALAMIIPDATPADGPFTTEPRGEVSGLVVNAHRYTVGQESGLAATCSCPALSVIPEGAGLVKRWA
jgi:hypothetical protein